MKRQNLSGTKWILFTIPFLIFFSAGITSAQARVSTLKDGINEPITVSVNTLISNSKAFDGKTVVVEGEVIGDIMVRGLRAWLSVLDNGTAVGVWIKTSMLGAVKSVGRYDRKGDIVRIRGIVYRADPENGGDFDIHATSLELLEPSRPIEHSISAVEEIAAFALSVGGLVFFSVWRKHESEIKIY